MKTLKSLFYVWLLGVMLSGLATPGWALQINRTSDSILLIDTANNVSCSYVSYQIVNNDAVIYTNLWVKADTFSGTIVSLGGGDPGQYAIGNLGVDQTNTAFFYLQATTTTATAQTHDIKIFRGRPDTGTPLLTNSFSLTVASAGQNSSSKINGASVAPNPPTLGGLFAITLTGNSGTIGGANTINFTPAVYTNWNAAAYELVSCSIIAAGGNTGTYSNTLFVTFGSSANTLFTNTYWFRAVAMAGSNTISPLFLESGGGGKYNDMPPPTAGTVDQVQPPTNTTLVSCSASVSQLYTNQTVTFTVRFTNSSAMAVFVDSIMDTLPPGFLYVTNSATFAGNASANPIASGQVLNFSQGYNIPATGIGNLTFQATPTLGGYATNSVFAYSQSTVIDTTIVTTDNVPATASVRVLLRPTATNDAYTVNENGTLTVAAPGVLANDNEPNGFTMAVVTALTTTPSHGSIAMNANGSFTYTPTTYFNGSDSFNYTMTNGNAGSSTATVSLTVNFVNQPPTLNSIGNLTTNADAALQTVNLNGITSGPASAAGSAILESSQTLTVTATSSNPSLIPNPTVNYTSANTTGTLTFTPVTDTTGTSTITVIVQDNGGTANGGVNSVTNTFTVTVNKANSSTAVVSSSNPSVYGQSGVTFTATVSGNVGNTPTGTIQFQTNGVNFGSAVSLSGGTATSASLPLTWVPGNYPVTAQYNGDTDYNTSSGTLSGGQTVNKANSSTAVASSSNPSVYGQSGVTFTATVSASSPGSGTPTGTVQFQTNGVNFGSAVSLSGGSATSLALAPLPPGSYNVTAVYSGDTDFNTSTSGTLSQTITQGTVTAAQSTVTVSPASVTANGSTTSTITVTLKNAYGYPVSGKTVTLAQTSGAGAPTISAASGLSSALGVVTFTVNSTTAATDVFTATDTTDSVIVTQTGSVTFTPGAATHLVFVQQPTATTAGAAISPSVTVYVEDANGNVVTNNSSSVTIAGTSFTGGSTLTVSAVNGVATFSGIYPTTAGSGITLTASDGSLAGATSSLFTVTAAAASQLVVTTEPSVSTVAGVVFAQQPVVKIEDQYGNVVTSGADSTRVVTAALTTGAGTLSGTLTATASAGVATFSGNNLSINLVGADKVMTFTTTGGVITSTATSPAFAITFAAASQLVVTTEPSASTVAGVAFAQQPVVKIEDQYGNVVTSGADSTRVVTAALTTGAGTLSGTLTATASAGVATFSGNNLSINLVGADKVLTFTTTGGVIASTATSPAFAITFAAASQLVVTTQPSASTVAGVAFAQQPVVKIEDQYGNVVTSGADSTVSVALTLTGGLGTLSGTASMSAVNGVADFAGKGLNINLVGTDKVLTATATVAAGQKTTTTSPAFVITAGAATHLVFVQQPTTTTAGSAISPSVTVYVEDANGNVVTNNSSSVTISGTAFTGGSTLTVSAINGVATFSGIYPTTAGSGITLTASDGSLAGATSSLFTVTAAAASKLVVTTQPSASTVAGVVFAQQPVVAIEDQFGNVVTSGTDSTRVVTAALTTGAGTLSGTLTAAASAGVATFSGNNLSINLVGADKVLTFTTTGGVIASTATSPAFAITLAPIDHYVVSASSPQIVGVPFTATVTAKDAYGDTVTTDSSTVVTMTSSGSAQFDSNGDSAFGDNTKPLASGTFTISTKDNVAQGVTLTATDGNGKTGTSSTITLVGYSIGNKVFNDLNNDGNQDYGENGISNVVMVLFTNSVGSPSGSALQTISTDENGDYRFDGLMAGTYVVVVDKANSTNLAGYVSSTGNSTDNTLTGQFLDHGIDTPVSVGGVVNGIASTAVTVGPGSQPLNEVVGNPAGMGQNGPGGDSMDNLVINFGFTPTFSIGNRVFADNGAGSGGIAGDGIQNGAEPGIANVGVQLKANEGSVLASTNTDANGYYRFDNLPAGTYTVFLPATNFASGGAMSGLVCSSSIVAGDKGNKGIYESNPSVDGIGTAPIALGSGLQPTGETDIGSGAGAHGPIGDAYDNLTIDFGIATLGSTTYSIGYRVFMDNGAGGGVVNNGIMDGSEAGIAGVGVQLITNGITVVATTTTDASGYYQFNTLVPGIYTVFLPATNFASGAPLHGLLSSTGTQPAGTAGDKGIDDSNPSANGITTGSITVGPSQQTIGFGMVGTPNTYSIGNMVFLDPDNDGQPDLDDLNEEGISGVSLAVFAADGSGNPTGSALAWTTTDINGFYRFDGLVAGTYVVVVDKVNSPILNTFRIGSVCSTNTTASGDKYNHGKSTPVTLTGVITNGIASVPVTLGPGLQPLGGSTDVGAGANGPNGDANDNLTLDFGFVPYYSLGNRVFADANNNGILDGGESGIGGVVMDLFTNNAGSPFGTVLATTNTDSSGYYRFDGLVSGTYVVVVDVASSGSALTGKMSSTGASTDATITGENRDHGIDIPLAAGSVLPGGIASTPVTIQEGNVTPVIGETDVSGTGQGAHGPNGDIADNLVMDFGFAPAVPSAYQITAVTTSPTAGVGDALTLQLVDSTGHVITSFTGDTNLTFSGLSAANGAPTVTDKNGNPVALGTSEVIHFVNGVSSAGGILTAYKAEGPVTLNVTDGSSSSTSTGGAGLSLTVSSGEASQLVYTTSPVTITAGAPSGTITVERLDAYGNLVTSGTTSVILSSSSAGTATFSSGSPVSITGGSSAASFTYTDTQAGTPTITAAGLGLSGATQVETVNPGVADAAHSVISASPASITANGTSTSTITVTEKDAYGNNLTASGVTPVLSTSVGSLGGVTATGNGTYTATLTSATTVATANVTGTIGGTAIGTSASVAFTAGALDHFVISGVGPSQTAGTAITGITLTAVDANGNTVTSFASSVDYGGTTGITGTSAAFTAGVLTGVSVTPTVAGSGTFTISASGKSGSASFNVAAGAASKLAFTTQPGNGTGGSALSPQPVVTLQDQYGNPVTNTAQNVTVAIQNNAGSGTLSGTATVALDTSTGTATFSGLSVDKAGAGYTLTATGSTVDTSAGTVVSSPFDVTVGPAAKLAFTTQPFSSTVAGMAFATEPVVAIQDAGGNTVTTGADSTTNVTLTLTTGAGTLSGTVSMAAVAGVADFSGLSINEVGTDKVLTATATLTGSVVVTTTTSPAFAITAGAASKLVFVQQPPATTMAGTAISPSVTVYVEDQYGNVVTNNSSSVAISGTTFTGGSTLTVSAINGVATFSGICPTTAGSGIQLTASASSLTGATSSSFTVNPAAASQLVVTTEPSASTVAGVVFAQQPVVAIEDQFGNVVTSGADSTVSVALTLTGGLGTLSGTASMSAVNGVADFAGKGLNINLVGTDKVLTATATVAAGQKTATTSPAFAITAGAATHLVFVQQPTTTTAGSAISPSVTVYVEDANGNVVTNNSSSVTISGTSFTDGSTLTVSAINGVATFSAMAPTAAGGATTLTASDGSLTGATSSPFTVNAAAASQLIYTSAPVTTTVDVPSTSITVQRQDQYGNPVTNGTTAVTLSSSSTGTATFSPASLSITGGASTASFTYTDTQYGTPTLTAASSGLTSATQTATILAYSIGDNVFADGNNNGSRDVEDAGINGVRMLLFTNSAGGPAGSVLQSTTTDIYGDYRFDNLPAGTYVVVVDQMNSSNLVGFVSSTGWDTNSVGDQFEDHGQDTPVTVAGGVTNGIAGIPVTVGPGLQPTNEITGNAPGAGQHGPCGDLFDNLMMTFGFAPAASVAGTVLVDMNGNGLVDVADTQGVSGVVIVLQTTNGAPLATNVTDSTGAYAFTDLVPGSYVVVQTVPAGWTSAVSTQIPLTLASGQASTGNTFLDTPVTIWNPAAGLTCNVTNAAGTAGAGYSVLNLTGYLNVQATASRPFTIGLASFNGNVPGLAANWSYASPYTWTIATTTAGVLYFDPSKFIVDTSLFTNDLAGGTFAVTTDGYNIQVVFTPNHPPVASPVTCGRAWGTSLRIAIAPLIATNTSDPDGDARVLFGIGTSTNNSYLATNSSSILFAPTNNLPESFTYVVRDLRASYRPGDTIQTATNWITVVITNAISSVQSITPTGSGGIVVRFAGVPGYAYDVESSTNLAAGSWTVVQTTNAPVNGVWEYFDSNPPIPTAFYRTQQHQN